MNNLSQRLKRIGDKMEFDMEYSLQSGKIIGQGSFGSVYRIVSQDDNVEWAVKIIEVPDREEYKGSAEHEMHIFLSMDSHPNIIGIKRVYTWINDLTHKFATVIVQELADKGLYDEFTQRKKANNPFSEDEILTFLKQSVDGLQYIMQKNGIYHRDIKTENLLLKNNQIKITDFGVSKSIQSEKIRSLQLNTITGTPLFLSPKLWDSYIKRSEYNVAHDLQKSDIYSLGLVFLQLGLLLSNSDLAGLNQTDGEKKLVPLLNRIRSNKLRTILASMLAFDEVKRADYAMIQKYFDMKDYEFQNSSMNQYVHQNSSKSPNQPHLPIFPNNNGVQQMGVNYRLIGAGAAGSERGATCSKHNKEIEYFCEYENCFEGLCTECKIIHSPSHACKIMAYKLAVSKFIDQNMLSQSYLKLNTTLTNDIKGKISKYSSTFKDEMRKASEELKKQLIQALDQSVNKWTQDIESKLQSSSRDAEMIHIQIKSEEKSLLETQQKFKQSPASSNYFYLQMVAKQQQQCEASVSSASEKVTRIQSDIQRLQKIESMYFNTINSTFALSRSLKSSFDNFFSDLILQSNEKPIQVPFSNSVSDSNVIQFKGVSQPYSNSNDPTPNGNDRIKQSNFLNVVNPNKQSNYIHGQPIRNRSSDTGQSIVDKFSNFFNTAARPIQKEVIQRQKETQGSPKATSKSVKESNVMNEVEFTPIEATMQYYLTSNQLQELIFIEQTKQKQLLIATQSDGKIIKINLQNLEKSEVQLHPLYPKCSLLLSNPKRLLCGTIDGKIFMFDPINMKQLDQPFKESQNSPITCMTIFEKKFQMLSGSNDGQVILWNLEKKIQERVYQRLHQGEIRGIITNQSDTHMITIGMDKSIIITELMTNRTLFSKPNAHYMSIVAIKKVKENSFFTAGADGFVKLWEWVNNELQLIGENRIHNSPITYLDYYSKYNLIVTSSQDGVIHFTDPTNYTQVASTQTKPLKGGAKGIHWQKPFLYTCDINSIQKWDNPKFVQNLRIIKKKVKQGSNCNIF